MAPILFTENLIKKKKKKNMALDWNYQNKYSCPVLRCRVAEVLQGSSAGQASSLNRSLNFGIQRCKLFSLLVIGVGVSCDPVLANKTYGKSLVKFPFVKREENEEKFLPAWDAVVEGVILGTHQPCCH